MPEYQQMYKTIQVLQSLSDLERKILYFMYDSDKEEFFIIAEGQNLLLITIYRNLTVEIEIDEL